MSGQYQLLYVDALTSTEHGTLPVSAMSFNDVLNGAGGLVASMPLESTSSGDRLTNGVAWPRVEQGKLEVDGSTMLYVLRDGVPLWCGMATTRDVNPDTNTLSIGAEGVLAYYRRRPIIRNLYYSAVDQLAIARDLISYAEDEVGPGLGTVVGSETSGVTRDRSYIKTDFKAVGSALEDLAGVINGFDFRFSPVRTAGVLSPRLYLTYPNTGRTTEHVLELGSNVNLLSERADGSKVANVSHATGSGSGPAILRRSDHVPGYESTRPRLEVVTSHPDVSNAATLKEHADLDLLRVVEPISHVEVEVLAGAYPRIGGYEVGDRMRVVGSYGYLSLDADYRVTARSIRVDDSGETVSLSLAPLAAFL